MCGITSVLGIVLCGGCKDLTNDPGLPAGTQDPSFYNTAEGARGLRAAAMANRDAAIPRYVIESGLLSDELVDPQNGSTSAQPVLGVIDPLDERLLPDGVLGGNGLQVGNLKDGTQSYAWLQTVRGSANLALGALATYDTLAVDRPQQQVLRGELFATQGYAEILLAELFCSGVPLSTLDFHQDFTYAPSSTAAQVYADAKTKLDSAIVLAVGSDSVLNLAKVLKGRAQLELGDYRAAADDVSTVPTTFHYRVTILTSSMGAVMNGNSLQVGTVADREGGNGLPFLSSGDPRAAVTVTCLAPNPQCAPRTVTMPAKYFDAAVLTSAGYAPFVVADGIEARLIEAEAALQTSPTSGQWLTTLNQLRASIGLSDTTDPGTAVNRVALLFHERAYWLFATGHRQGDLRRLLRQYGGQYPQFRTDQQVYPSGVYVAPGQGRYGNDVNVPIPTTEYNNPNYHGCLDRNA